MSVGPNPPPSAPMLSPDHKWVWDGSQWQPIADPSDPAHKSVFAAYNHVTSNVPVPVADARPLPGPPPVAFVAPVPLNVGRPKARRATTPQVPGLLWDRPQTGLNKYLYIAGGGIAALIVLVLGLQFVGHLALPRSPAATAQSSPAPTGPPQLTERSDFARADRYINGILYPALTNLNDTLRPVQLGCVSSMTVVCGAAIPNADKQLKNVISVMNGASSLVPSCIAPGVANMRHDLLAMDANLIGAQAAFDVNQQGVVLSDLAGYRYYLKALANDEKLTTQALQPTCDQTVTGP